MMDFGWRLKETLILRRLLAIVKEEEELRAEASPRLWVSWSPAFKLKFVFATSLPPRLPPAHGGMHGVHLLPTERFAVEVFVVGVGGGLLVRSARFAWGSGGKPLDGVHGRLGFNVNGGLTCLSALALPELLRAGVRANNTSGGMERYFSGGDEGPSAARRAGAGRWVYMGWDRTFKVVRGALTVLVLRRKGEVVWGQDAFAHAFSTQ